MRLPMDGEHGAKGALAHPTDSGSSAFADGDRRLYGANFQTAKARSV
jgi:hypothetical protein